MTEIQKNPEAVLNKFDEWLEQIQKANLFQSAYAPVHFKNISLEIYGTALSHVYFNELLRKDPRLEEIREEASERIIEAYSGGVPLKLTFPPLWHCTWGKANPRLLRPFIKLLMKKGVIARWKGRTKEKIAYNHFHETLWEWYFYELVRRGEVDNVRKKDELYRKYYNNTSK